MRIGHIDMKRMLYCTERIPVMARFNCDS